MCTIPTVRYRWHFSNGCGGSNRFNIRNHISTTDQLNNRTYANFIGFNELSIEPSGIFYSDSANTHRVNTYPGFQITVFTGRPDYIQYMCLGYLITNYHFKSKSMFGIFVYSFMYFIIGHNNSIDFVFICTSPFHQSFREKIIGQCSMIRILYGFKAIGL